MKEIKLTKGKVALVDDEDYERVMAMGKWYATTSRKTFYASRYIPWNGGRKEVKMHRVILGVCDPKELIDHEDGNGLNNQRNNIRRCTNKDNLRNQGLRKGNTSGFKGVSWDSKSKKWAARIHVNNRVRMYLGLFNCPIEAARAYNAAALIHHGEFARLNEIPA